MDRHAENLETAQRQKSRALHVHQDDDGMVVIRGRLTPEADPPSLGQQQADALAMITEAPGASGTRYQVVVHVDAPVLADPEQPGQSALEDGQHVSAETSRRLACDASRVVMTRDADGRIIDVGARTRTVPPSLRRAPTTPSNLALLCRRHHRSVHEDGFQIQRLADGELEFRRPDGWVIPEAPAFPALAGNAEEAPRAQSADQNPPLHEAIDFYRHGGSLLSDISTRSTPACA